MPPTLFCLRIKTRLLAFPTSLTIKPRPKPPKLILSFFKFQAGLAPFPQRKASRSKALRLPPSRKARPQQIRRPASAGFTRAVTGFHNKWTVCLPVLNLIRRRKHRLVVCRRVLCWIRSLTPPHYLRGSCWTRSRNCHQRKKTKEMRPNLHPKPQRQKRTLSKRGGGCGWVCRLNLHQPKPLLIRTVSGPR